VQYPFAALVCVALASPRPASPAEQASEVAAAAAARDLASRASETIGPPSPDLSAPRRPPRADVFAPALEAAGLTAVTMVWNRWVGEASWANVSLRSVARNLRGGWTFDDDQFLVNELGHPYQGSFSFAAARSAGLGFWGALPYTLVSSAVWEIAGETQPPAINDQVTTTIGGAVLGEVLHRTFLDLRGPGDGGWRALAAIVSPMSAVNRSALGVPDGERREPSGWELSAGPVLGRIPSDVAGAAPDGWEGQARLELSLVHGLAYDPDFELDEPFDHYRLEVGYAKGPSVRFTLRATGLVAGARIEALDRVRGVWGAFAGFDLDTPGAFRVATTSVGVGAIMGALLSEHLSIEGTAIASGVGMGAVGMLPGNPPEVRDYRLGPGAQTWVELQLTARDRAALKLASREVLVAGADGGGHDLVGTLSASALVQVARTHGVGIEVTAARRDAQDEGGAKWTQSGRWVQVFYRLGRLSAPRPDARAPDGGVATGISL
jgi:Domain of unknown function (DUF3943)